MNYRTVLPLALLIGLTACTGDRGGVYEIETVRTLEEPQKDVADELKPDGVRFLWQRPAGEAKPGAGAGGPQGALTWTLPEGWIEKPAGNMRLGSFAVEGKPSIDCSITQLPSDGGGLTANVNRWRSQMGLPAQTADEIENLPTSQLLGREAVMIDLVGTYTGMGGGEGKPNQRMVGRILTLPAVSLFVKLTGDHDEVGAEFMDFEALCDSITMGAPPGHHAGHGTTPPDAGEDSSTDRASGGGDGPIQWTVPEGWERQAGQRPMRVATFNPGGNEKVECYVTILGGDGGGVLANINRWLGQFSAPELDEDGVMALPRITVMGESVPLVEATGPFAGMGAESMDDAALVGTLAPAPGEKGVVFVKMIGPREAVQAQRDAFVRFCESFRP